MATGTIGIDQGTVAVIVGMLKMVYTNGFRHSYSQFLPIVIRIYHNEESKYSLDFLSTSLIALATYLDKDTKEEEQFKAHVFKLCDHLNLELELLQYYSSSTSELEIMKQQAGSLENQLSTAISQLDSYRSRIDSLQTEFITVLGVFAAIIIGFSGGLSFIGNAISSLSDVPLLHSILSILICGLVIFNSVFVLMYLIGKITGKNIYEKCVTDDCTCNNGKPRCNVFTRVRRRLPYVFYLNLLITILIIITVGLLFLGNFFIKGIAIK